MISRGLGSRLANGADGDCDQDSTLPLDLQYGSGFVLHVRYAMH